MTQKNKMKAPKLKKLSCWICNSEFASPLDLMLHTIAEHKQEKTIDLEKTTCLGLNSNLDNSTFKICGDLRGK